VQVISRTAPEAAARVLSDMATRMVFAHQNRNRSFHSCRRAAAAGTGPVGGYVAPPRAGSNALFPDGIGRWKGELATIAFVPVGGPPPRGSGVFGGKAVRRCDKKSLWVISEALLEGIHPLQAA
jgi:hypothetical protein